MGLLDFHQHHDIYCFTYCRMNYRKLILFYVCVMLYGMNRALPIVGIHIPFLRNYLSDLVFLPVLFTMALMLMQKVFGGDYLLSKSKLIITFILVCFVNEVLLPYISKKFTADVADIFCYLFGLLLFIFLMNKKQLIISTSENKKP